MNNNLKTILVEVAIRFNIDTSKAEALANEITETVRENWEKLAVQYKLSRGQIDDMRPAFSTCYEEIL